MLLLHNLPVDYYSVKDFKLLSTWVCRNTASVILLQGGTLPKQGSGNSGNVPSGRCASKE